MSGRSGGNVSRRNAWRGLPSSRDSRRPREDGSHENDAEDLRMVYDLRSHIRRVRRAEAKMSGVEEDGTFAWEEDFAESVEEYLRSYTEELEELTE